LGDRGLTPEYVKTNNIITFTEIRNELNYTNQKSSVSTHLGKGITSLIFCIPVTNCISLSKPRPKPE
jgi:hypothetical protein